MTCLLVRINSSKNYRESLLILLEILAGNPTSYWPYVGYSIAYSEASSYYTMGPIKFTVCPISSALPWKKMMFQEGFSESRQRYGTLCPDLIR
jgi:hypothetical protein